MRRALVIRSPSLKAELKALADIEALFTLRLSVLVALAIPAVNWSLSFNTTSKELLAILQFFHFTLIIIFFVLSEKVDKNV